jgi:uncharacterized phage protein gp47/JayE
MEAIGFNHWAEGSRIGAIGRVISAYLVDMWNSLADIEAQSNPSTARGVYLDRIGTMMGVERLPPQVASTVGRGPAVKFTNTGSTSYNVPQGTRIWNPTDPDIGFFTVQSLTLGGGEEGFIDVVAGTAGDTYNVSAGSLTAHNAGSQVSVLNVRPIGGGTFFESDDSYRFRIKEALLSKNGATETAIRQELLKVPGVRDVIIHSGVRGNGSVDVVVIPVDRFASESLLEAAEIAVADTVAAGISWRVLTPVTRRVNLVIQLQLRGGAVLEEIRALVESNVRAYIDNLRVNDGQSGSDLIYNELVSRVQDSSPEIIDSSIDMSVDGIQVLQTNITTNPGERLVSGSVVVK